MSTSAPAPLQPPELGEATQLHGVTTALDDAIAPAAAVTFAIVNHIDDAPELSRIDEADDAISSHESTPFRIIGHSFVPLHCDRMIVGIVIRTPRFAAVEGGGRR